MKPLYGHPRSWNQNPPDLDAVQAWGLDSLEGARSQGFSTLLVQASMGTGKTVLAAKHAKAIEKQGRRVVFLCHLRTLVEQAAEKFEAWGVDVQIEQGRHKARSHFGRPSHIIASKDSLHPNRIEDFFRRSGLSGVEVEVIYDECLTGDTIVQTEKGKLRIDQVEQLGAGFIVSHNGSSVCCSRISGFKDQGVRDVIEIGFASGRRLRCTRNHPLMTRSGWVPAGMIREGELIQVLASADAARFSALVPEGERCGSCRDTRTPCGNDLSISGRTNGTNFWRKLLSVPVVAVRRLGLAFGHSILSSPVEVPVGIPDSSGSTDNVPRTGGSLSLNLRSQRFSELSSETPVSFSRIARARTHVLPVIMDWFRKIGCGTRLGSFIGFSLMCGSIPMEDSAPRRSAWRLPVFPPLGKSGRRLTREIKSQSRSIGLILSGGLDWHGGSQTTAVPAGNLGEVSHFTLRVIRPPRSISSRPGLGIDTEPSRSISPRASTGLSDSPRKPAGACFLSSIHLFPVVCDTRFDQVVSVRPRGRERVYDLEIEGTHCFFANGVLVHNCHLATTPSWSRPVQGLRPVFTIGLSGTPIASNGRKLYGPGAPFQALCCRYDFLTACRHRNLVPPVLVECGVTVDLRDIKITRQAGGRDYDLKELTLRINESLGTLIRAAKERIIEWEVKRFLQFLPDVGVCRAAERMWSGMRKPDGSPYRVRAIYHGLPDADEVKRSYHRGDLDGLLSCQMLDVGFDDPPTDGIILSTPTKSAVKILQQGGRGSRLFPGKDRYVIIGYRWETADEGPQSTLDLLLRGIPDERTRSLVCDLMRGPGRLNFLEAVERAEIERRREIAEDRRRYGDLPVACVDAPVDHTVRVMDLVQGVSVHDAHTMKQLKRCGLTNPEIIRMTPREADRFLDRWVNGRDSTLATYKQVQALLRMGISERDALPLTKRQAQGLIFKGLPPKPAAWSHV